MKKGFVFLETLLVLVVLSMSILGIYSTYINIISNIDSRTYYDNIGDLYKTDIIRSEIDKTKIPAIGNYIKITKSNCTSYMSNTCLEIMNDLKAENIYINISNLNIYLETSNTNIPNSLKLYTKTINVDTKRYIIVNYKKGNKNYYSSLRI